MFGANVYRLLKNRDDSLSALADLPLKSFVSTFPPLDVSLFFEQQA